MAYNNLRVSHGISFWHLTFPKHYFQSTHTLLLSVNQNGILLFWFLHTSLLPTLYFRTSKKNPVATISCCKITRFFNSWWTTENPKDIQHLRYTSCNLHPLQYCSRSFQIIIIIINLLMFQYLLHLLMLPYELLKDYFIGPPLFHESYYKF